MIRETTYTGPRKNLAVLTPVKASRWRSHSCESNSASPASDRNAV